MATQALRPGSVVPVSEAGVSLTSRDPLWVNHSTASGTSAGSAPLDALSRRVPQQETLPCHQCCAGPYLNPRHCCAARLLQLSTQVLLLAPLL